MSSCVGIVYSDAYRKISSISPKFEDRFSLVMDLLNAYGLVDHLLRIPPVECFSEPQEMELLTPFHSSEYIAAVERLSRLYSDDDEPILTKENEDFFDEYNLFYDCPGFTSLYEYSLASVRGSIAAADSLINNHCKVILVYQSFVLLF
ncbi:unnamed protein product [Protopolystoma xenopodis]|uniref:Histone deacetylase domain-containing protein n=1 Tax=Protopolystoma xenopodis TaxID=117903 RepID=A0A448X1W4_9PLAT|nr:unnamed protein product [Protopolystoma xenopodis]